jgi:hypothetical protein
MTDTKVAAKQEIAQRFASIVLPKFPLTQKGAARGDLTIPGARAFTVAKFLNQEEAKYAVLRCMA